MLEGLSANEAQQLGRCPWDRALLVRVQESVIHATAVRRAEQVRRAQLPVVRPPQSAKDIAMNVQTVDTSAIWAQIDEKLHAPQSLGKMRPRQTIELLAKQASAGTDVISVLDEAVVALALQQIWHSRASVASGLRAWGGFAEQVLGYEPSATLPPRSTSDARTVCCRFPKRRHSLQLPFVRCLGLSVSSAVDGVVEPRAQTDSVGR